MTKKTTINKIISSKAFWIIISLLGSFLLWMYIMSTEETTIEKTFSNVKVVYQGADDLRAARGLIVTDADADSVTVRLKGTRRVLGNLSSADLSAVIDVSGISQAREMQVSYSLQYHGFEQIAGDHQFFRRAGGQQDAGGQGRLYRQRQGGLHS